MQITKLKTQKCVECNKALYAKATMMINGNVIVDAEGLPIWFDTNVELIGCNCHDRQAEYSVFSLDADNFEVVDFDGNDITLAWAGEEDEEDEEDEDEAETCKNSSVFCRSCNWCADACELGEHFKSDCQTEGCVASSKYYSLEDGEIIEAQISDLNRAGQKFGFAEGTYIAVGGYHTARRLQTILAEAGYSCDEETRKVFGGFNQETGEKNEFETSFVEYHHENIANKTVTIVKVA